MADSKFKPAWWLPHPHLQTLWPTLCRRREKNISLKRERFEFDDGDFIDLFWAGEGTGPLVLILHGLEGSIESHYARGMLKTLNAHGWRGVFMHFRGCSGEPNRLSRGYHSGETGDLGAVISHLIQREPSTPLCALGFSLGGNVLLKWLGETKKENPLKAAIAVSVPFQLHQSSLRINTGFSKLYQWHFLKCLRERLIKKFQVVPPPENFDLDDLHCVRTMREFDEKVTAPLHGFLDAYDYYTRSSSRSYLHSIKVPTLILHAKDDPFMTEETIPTQEELSDDVILEVYEQGGHVGFVSGKFPWNPEYWLEKRIPLFLKNYL